MFCACAVERHDETRDGWKVWTDLVWAGVAAYHLHRTVSIMGSPHSGETGLRCVVVHARHDVSVKGCWVQADDCFTRVQTRAKHVQFLQHPFEYLLHAFSLAIKIKMRMCVSRVHGDVWRFFTDVTLELVPSLKATTTSAGYHPPSNSVDLRSRSFGRQVCSMNCCCVFRGRLL